jgi:histidyl-tRNA synthetase
MRFKTPRGTRDFLPEEMMERRYAERVIREVFESYGYREVATPTFETLELITAKSGEEIRRHIYHFKDKSNRDLALRPELTAPAMRLYVNMLQFEPKPVKLYYFGNCFRYERPQSGRYREFWQAGIELIGSPYPEAEAEVIAVALDALEKLGLMSYELAIGHIGVLRAILAESGVSGEEQDKVMSAIDKGEGVKELLDEIGVAGESREKLLRTLKLAGERERVIKEAAELLENSEKALTELEKLRELLNILEGYGIKNYSLDLGIARGLDYYTGMVFEIYAPKLGAEKQICGGGAYSLAEVFGGEAIATSGFAFGFDRLMLALKKEKVRFAPASNAACLVVPTSEAVLQEAIKVSRALRKHNACELELTRKKLGKALRYADQRGFPYVVIVGDEELSRGYVVLRDMHSGEQKEVKISKLEELKLK